MSPRASASTSHAPDWLENAFSWASGALVLALVGYLLWDATREDRPAAFTVSVEAPASIGGAVHVPVNVQNTGDQAVQSLEVAVLLQRDGSAGSERIITFDWLAGRSRRRGVAVFPDTAAAGARASAEIRGFAHP